MTELFSALRGRFGSPPWAFDIGIAAVLAAAAGCAGVAAGVAGAPAGIASAAGSLMDGGTPDPPGSHHIGLPAFRSSISASVSGGIALRLR